MCHRQADAEVHLWLPALVKQGNRGSACIGMQGHGEAPRSVSYRPSVFLYLPGCPILGTDNTDYLGTDNTDYLGADYADYLGTDYTDYTDFFFFPVIYTIGGLENKNYLIREIRVIRAKLFSYEITSYLTIKHNTY